MKFLVALLCVLLWSTSTDARVTPPEKPDEREIENGFENPFESRPYWGEIRWVEAKKEDIQEEKLLRSWYRAMPINEKRVCVASMYSGDIMFFLFEGGTDLEYSDGLVSSFSWKIERNDLIIDGDTLASWESVTLSTGIGGDWDAYLRVCGIPQDLLKIFDFR